MIESEFAIQMKSPKTIVELSQPQKDETKMLFQENTLTGLTWIALTIPIFRFTFGKT